MVNLSYKNNFWGYFTLYYRIMGSRFLYYLLLSILISFMDGMGLAMFIPLLQAVGGDQSAGRESLGELHYITDFLKSLGFELNITTVLLVLITLFTLKGLFKYIQLAYYAKLREIFIKAVRFNLVNNLYGLSYTSFLKLDAGKIQNVLTVEVSRLFQTVTFYFNAAQALAMLATYIVLAFLANYQFAVLVGAGSVLSNFIYRTIYKKTKKVSMKITEKGSDFNGFLLQAVMYFKYLKATDTFTKYTSKLKNVINETEHLSRKIGVMNAIASSVKEPIVITIVCLVVLFQVNWMGTGISTLILSLLLFYRALTYLVVLQTQWQGFIEYSGGMHAVSAMSQEMAASQEPKGTEPFSVLEKEIRLNDVVFNYESIRILSNVSITIPARQTIALIGESGSGKTTLANLIAGLIKPKSGEILVDGVPLNEVDLDHYRNKIGYISQEAVIFNDNIYNNITFWAEPTQENLKRFNHVLEMASLTDFINSLPEKEFTKVGDNGILISGGQKQRISIARELFKNCEILIFDEATSALDSETEKVIQENIEMLHGKYTMIVIAHRLSTIKEADTIFLLEDGRISASGDFDEMMSKSTRFKKMVTFQTV